MLDSCDVIAFVGTSDPVRAQAFYEDILGLPLVGEGDQALVFNVNGTQLRISKVPEHTPPRYTVLGWDVSDIHSAVSALQQRGISFEQFNSLPQDEQGVCTFPNGD